MWSNYCWQGLVTFVPDISTIVFPTPPMTSPVYVALSMALMALLGASRIPTAFLGTIVVTVALGFVMLYYDI